MNTDFEFLSEEPIENVITPMHFKMDKVIYFGYQDAIDRLKQSTEKFLTKNCGVGRVIFHAMSHTDMQSMMKTIRQAIEQEIAERNTIYFDMTGGEEAIVAAFGLLAGEFDTPLHAFDIYKNKITRLEEGSKRSIMEAEPNYVSLDLDELIELHGGKINYSLHKSMKSLDDPEFSDDVEKLWDVENDYTEEWNLLSIFLRNHMMPEKSLEVRCDLDKIDHSLKSSGNHLNSLEGFNEIMERLADAGLILDLKHSDGEYSFRYKSEGVRDCLKDGGSTLELYIYKREQARSDDCKIGVHLDWDGELHYTPGIDVLNEIDVLALNGNIPTFISCKTGKMGPSNTLHALYELETVAGRFGGRYARKVLVTSRPLADVYLTRAEEMGITVEQIQ